MPYSHYFRKHKYHKTEGKTADTSTALGLKFLTETHGKRAVCQKQTYLQRTLIKYQADDKLLESATMITYLVLCPARRYKISTNYTTVD